MKILLVEDEREFADALRSALERERFVVDHADRLDVAREAVLSGTYDLVLLDRTLPDGDGSWRRWSGVGEGRSCGSHPNRRIQQQRRDDAPLRAAEQQRLSAEAARNNPETVRGMRCEREAKRERERGGRPWPCR